MRIELAQRSLGANREVLRIGGSECGFTPVPNTDIGGERVTETGARRTQTKILLDTVIAAQRTAVEWSNRVKTRAAHEHARPAGKRRCDRGGRIGAAKQEVQRAQCVLRRHRVPDIGARITGNTAIVGERNDSADVASAGSGSDQPIEPVVGNFGVAVEYDDVALGVKRGRAVDCRGETLAKRLLDERQSRALRELAQPANKLWLRARVVDRDQLERRLLLAGQYAFDATPRRLDAAIDRDDDVDRHPLLASKRRLTRPRGQRSPPRQPAGCASRALVSSSAPESCANASCVRLSSASSDVTRTLTASSRWRELARSFTAITKSASLASALLPAASSSQNRRFSANRVRS